MRPGEITEDQSAVIALLADPATHDGVRPARIDTHAAIVFLAGDRVYKLKRAIWYPFLDFSTLAKRHAACEAEVRLNHRTAPDLYIGVAPVTRGPSGKLALEGRGEPVDWVVVMRRFDQELLFDRMAERDALREAHILDLADTVAEFHAAAEVRDDQGGREAMRWIVDDNIEEMRGMPDIFAASVVAQLARRCERALEDTAALLDTRRAQGFVRHCHGDLHLRNICLWKGRPTLFDCLEFDVSLACTDVLYDLAFLLMDLRHRDRAAFANLLFNRYLQRTGDLTGLAALPLFLSCRAAIRAKVEASAAVHKHDAREAETTRAVARGYCDLAIDYFAAREPCLIGIGGESGSGKSTVAAVLAHRLGCPPGAVVIRSDVTRKALHGRRMEDHLTDDAYGPEATARTYARVIEDARVVLAAGMTVIADAVYADAAERDALASAAQAAGIRFAGFWLDVPLRTRIERVTGRSADASDATADFLRRTPRREAGPMNWTRIDASGGVTAVVDRIASLVADAAR